MFIPYYPWLRDDYDIWISVSLEQNNRIGIMEDDRDDEDARKQTTKAESMNATKDALTMLSTANTVKFSNQQE